MWFRKSLSIAAGIGLAVSATAASAEIWRFGLEEIEGSVQYEYAAEFKRLIEEKTDGDVTVELYPYGSLGGLTDIYDAVQGGAIQLAFGSGFLGGTVPESQLFSLNFILPEDEWLTTKQLNSPEFLESDAWQSAFQDRGLHPIGIVPEGFQVWTANKPIRTPEDMEGLQIRVMDNRLLLETYRAYGAQPTTIEYGELYSALQQGQAEGNIQPVFAHEEMNFYEVQDYMIFANQAQFVATAMTNYDWYQGLSEDRQAMINETADELVRYIHDVQQELNDKRLDIITENSDIEIVRLNAEQRDQFRELAKPVREVFVDEIGPRGQELLDLVLGLYEDIE
ncbi:TRAP transporter substrate-binding protein [Arhodomonas sp. SL1]|uniref:TRAP transporter substrate-binding protein n=1 Tax=Arhodomonas sp. SL1 TaxID=3425691 RepID=UPI003F882DB8